MAYELLASNSAILTETNNVLANILTVLKSRLLEVVLSAFAGGFFAAFFTNHFETKRRIREKRSNKYYEHRNTIVQIEHELIPARLNLSRNLESIKGALENTNEVSVRLILRFFRLSLSTGLSLRILNLELINKYSEVYILFETVNSDIEYINGLVYSIREDMNKGRIDQNLLNTYILMINHLNEKCEKADKESLRLLSLAKIAVKNDDKNVRELFIKKGGEIVYLFTKHALKNEDQKTEKEENRKPKENEKREQFVAPYLDLKKRIVTQ